VAPEPGKDRKNSQHDAVDRSPAEGQESPARRAYLDGYADFSRSVRIFDCPFGLGRRREAWLTGWAHSKLDRDDWRRRRGIV